MRACRRSHEISAELPKAIPDDELDSDDLGPLLKSLCFFKANYRHHDDDAMYCYEALRSFAALL